MYVVGEPFWTRHRQKVMCKTKVFAMLGNKKASKMTSSILASIVAKIPQLIYLQN